MEPGASEVSASIARARQAAAPKWLGDIAFQEPRLARTLLAAAKKGLGYRMAGDGWLVTETLGWEMISIKGRWDKTTADQTVQGQTLGTVESDLWIRRVTYTVRRPRFAKGSIWKAQSDYFNRLNPNIDLQQFIVHSFCNYLINTEPTPLENTEAVFECVCPAGLVLKCSASIDVLFTNVRELEEDEVPTEAIITLHGTRLPTGLYNGCDFTQVIAELEAEGVFAPRDLGPGCP
jgi:hypothetical protein